MILKIKINYSKKLHIDKYIYNATRYKLPKMIFNIKRTFFENQLTVSIGKPKDLWKTLKSLGLLNKSYFCEVSTMKINNTVEHDVNSVLKSFKSYFSIEHDILLQKVYAIVFSKHTVNWFMSFLSNRFFLFNLVNNFSQATAVSFGVLQGFVFRPLLFLIYASDMS